MAKLFFGMNVSLDGYVDHMKIGPPDPSVFRHFIDHINGLTGMVYGRNLYEIMRYWDDDLPDWKPEGLEFAAAWRSKPKWVVSKSLKSVGPNAALVEGDLETFLRTLKSEKSGEISIGGPNLVGSLANSDLIDEYRLYLKPVVLGSGVPFFAGARPPLRLVANETIGKDVLRLTYVPAETQP